MLAKRQVDTKCRLFNFKINHFLRPHILSLARPALRSVLLVFFCKKIVKKNFNKIGLG